MGLTRTYDLRYDLTKTKENNEKEYQTHAIQISEESELCGNSSAFIPDNDTHQSKPSNSSAANQSNGVSPGDFNGKYSRNQLENIYENPIMFNLHDIEFTNEELSNQQSLSDKKHIHNRANSPDLRKRVSFELEPFEQCTNYDQRDLGKLDVVEGRKSNPC